MICKAIYIIHRDDRMPRLVFLCVKNSDIFLTPIEMQAANRLAIIVIKQNTEIALGISMNNPFRINHRPHDCFYDMEALQLFKSRLDSILSVVINRLV